MSKNECVHGKPNPRQCAKCCARAREAIDRLHSFGMTGKEIAEYLADRAKKKKGGAQ